MKQRLDVFLYKKGFFKDAESAARAVMAGLVILNEKRMDKPGEMIAPDKNPQVRIKTKAQPY
ncbi:MAG: TlyA family rRNA (cytidine-2'-O)-methyltransferase, partial [Fusobacteriaceae bacterium]|nr:TlyA family rRNA (cytidine-2'-O)-methyltransferase [Fusobacteriaceae bacterium]